MRVLVIGGAGFIGSHLVDRLLTDGHFVRVLDRSPPELHPYWIKTGQLQYVLGEFVDQFSMGEAVKDIHVAFHLVSTTIPATSIADMAFDVQSNLIGTLNFLKAAVDARIRRVLFVSSGGTVYGKTVVSPIKESAPTEPICSYGITKLAVEKYLCLFELLHGLPFIAFRLSNPFGEGQRPGAQGAIAAFVNRMLRGEPIEIWGDGSVVRDYIYIENAIDALVKGMEYAGSHRIFNLGSGEGRSLNELLEALEHVAGRKAKRNYVSSRAIDTPTNVLDIDLIRKEMGWVPRVTFEEGLARTWEWYREALAKETR
ncbi:MAG: NAD-dependent epimerase/dehydratase family protein [Steroidobacteraceae bacterium]